MTLYNLHGDGPYTISKFTRDGTLESTYELSTDGRTCTCPAGHRHSCRHRDMLGALRPLTNTEWFWDHDRGMAVDFNSVPKRYYDSVATPAMIPAHAPTPELHISGVQVFGMDDMLGIHNAIAEAVGEPEAKLAEDTPQDISPAVAKPGWRRL